MRWVMGSSVKTVKVKIYRANKGKADYLEETKKILDQALAFYQQLLLENPTIVEAEDNLRQVERLSHRTKDNPNPPYEAPELPSITKRSVINSALGSVSSYLTRLSQWEEKGKKKGRPSLPTASTMPTFYYSDYNLEMKDIQNQFISLRVYNGYKWGFVNYPVQFTAQFMDKYQGHANHLAFEENKKVVIKELIMSGLDEKDAKNETNRALGINPYEKMCSPSLSYHKKKKTWYLCIPFEKTVYMQKLENYRKDKEVLTTLAIDLGINHLGVITIKQGDRLLKTEFISGAKVNDIRFHALQKITQNQRLSGKPVKGESSNQLLWDYVQNLNKDTAHQVSSRIITLAKEHKVDVIIFEHLKNFSQRGVSKARKLNLKLNYWLCGKIIEYTQYKAYGEKIYVCQVSAAYTSQICYRNSFSGERFSFKGANGKSLIMFEDGTVLNADFNASMNLHRKFYKTFPSIDIGVHKAKKEAILDKIAHIKDKTLQQCRVA